MSVTVEVAWGSDWRTASPTWTDITSDVLDIAVRKEARLKTDGVTAGQVTLTVDNRDDAWTPAYSGSPNYPNVIPGLPVRITKDTGSEWYVATAYVETFRPDVDGRPPTCVLDAYDVLRTAKAIGKPRYLRDVIVADSPSWYWTLDRWGGTSNDRAIDESGNSRHGFTSSAWAAEPGAIVPGIIPGQDGWALDCSKNPSPWNNLYQTTGAVLISGNVDYTIELWWDRAGQTISGAGTRYLFQKYTADYDHILISYDLGQIHWRSCYGTITSTTYDMTTVYGPLQIVCRHLASGTMELYINGVLEGSSSDTTVLTGANEYIGSAWNGSAKCEGVIDEIAVWKGAALNSTQIAEHWDAGNGGSQQDELSGARVDRIITILDNAGTNGVDVGALEMDTVRDVPLLDQLGDVAKAESGMVSGSTDGGIRFRSGLAVPPSPRVQSIHFGGIAHWPLTEPSGTSVADMLPPEMWEDYGAPWDATLTGTYTRNQASLLDCYPAEKSTDLNGTSGYAYVPYDSDWNSLYATGRVACGAWIRPDNVTSTRGIIARSGASAVDWSLYINSSGKLVFEYVNSSGTTRSVTGATTLSAGTTYHVAGATIGTKLFVYVNGIQDGATTVTDSCRYTASRQVWIGRRTSSYFDGRIQHAFWSLCYGATESQVNAWMWGHFRAGRPAWTFANQGTGIGYQSATVEYDDDAILASATITARDGFGSTTSPVTIEGTATLGDRLNDTTEAVKTLSSLWPDTIRAATLIDRRGTPRLAVTGLTLVPELDSTDAWNFIVQANLGDRVLVNHTTPSGAQIATPGWVTAVGHEKHGRLWTTRIELEP